MPDTEGNAPGIPQLDGEVQDGPGGLRYIEEEVGGGDEEDTQEAMAERRKARSFRHRYKIQEVIKRRQILLVQVVKEERGNKGAALTTYLSLAGRYSVLMPNSGRGGGISRKITNAADRKRLKSAAQGLDLPEGMGLIIRTAGENRTKLEIRRDYDYLLRLWDTIREKTLSSNAPACVYEEGNLVKRVIRDLYNKDVQDVVVEGEEGFRVAKDFMRMLMPSPDREQHDEPADPCRSHDEMADVDRDRAELAAVLRGGGHPDLPAPDNRRRPGLALERRLPLDVLRLAPRERQSGGIRGSLARGSAELGPVVSRAQQSGEGEQGEG